MTSFLVAWKKQTKGKSVKLIQMFANSYFFRLFEIFPAMESGTSASGQALKQFLAMLITLAFAIVGGTCTGKLDIFCF